ncbi:hypothetical protein BJ741DRAFT_592681 [Chytriomyces cf. hyalinus JEL632]|nr:hypothetical protein BJ741DRAFT_592681 [Chytriomyces cf. hyalinus JEL632]
MQNISAFIHNETRTNCCYWTNAIHLLLSIHALSNNNNQRRSAMQAVRANSARLPLPFALLFGRAIVEIEEPVVAGGIVVTAVAAPVTAAAEALLEAALAVPVPDAGPEVTPVGGGPDVTPDGCPADAAGAKKPPNPVPAVVKGDDDAAGAPEHKPWSWVRTAVTSACAAHARPIWVMSIAQMHWVCVAERPATDATLFGMPQASRLGLTCAMAPSQAAGPLPLPMPAAR